MTTLSPAVAAQARQVTEIAPGASTRVDLRELYRYRELLFMLAWRDLNVRYRQTLLGALWVMGQPLLGMLIFTFLFHRLARIEAGGGLPYAVFVGSGLLVWTFFAGAVQSAGNSLVGSSHLISKVYFPRLIVPLSATLVSLADFGVAALLLVPLMLIYALVPTPAVLLLPLVVLLGAALALGVGVYLSAWNVRYRDVRVLIPFLLQLWMYATPVVYPLALLPPAFRTIALLNPVTGVVEAFRACLLGTPASGPAVLWSCVVALVIVPAGALHFRRAERLFADLL